MTDFDYDAKQKKDIARSAARRKCGSKSKRCTLPSDHLTDAQKRKLNGPVESVKLDQPMKWNQFKALPDSLKKEYLVRLIQDYGANAGMLGRMFGVTSNTVLVVERKLGIPTAPHGGAQHGAAYERKQAMWEAFCNGVVGGGNSITEGANDQIEAQNEQIEAQNDRIEAQNEQTETRAWDLDSPDHMNARRCEDPLNFFGDIEERAKERLVDLMEQGAAQADEETKTQYEAYYDAARDAVGEMLKSTHAPAPVCGEEDDEPDWNGCMTALAARYEGDARKVSELLRNMMTMFGSDKVKVKLSVEVMPE